MKVLALDCSAKAVSVAIADENKLIAESFLNINLTHSETLMPMIEQVLSNSKISLNEIDSFAVTAGPGSFTGVRIGISAIKGLAFADEKPVYPFSTLLAMALTFENSGFNGYILALMDARRNQFYNGLFKVENGKIIRISKDSLSTQEEIAVSLKNLEENIILIGDGAELFYSLSENKNNIKPANSAVIYQKASYIALSAARGENLPDKVSPESLQTVYLRKSQAEREREAKLNS